MTCFLQRQISCQHSRNVRDYISPVSRKLLTSGGFIDKEQNCETCTAIIEDRLWKISDGNCRGIIKSLFSSMDKKDSKRKYKKWEK